MLQCHSLDPLDENVQFSHLVEVEFAHRTREAEAAPTVRPLRPLQPHSVHYGLCVCELLRAYSLFIFGGVVVV